MPCAQRQGVDHWVGEDQHPVAAHVHHRHRRQARRREDRRHLDLRGNFNFTKLRVSVAQRVLPQVQPFSIVIF